MLMARTELTPRPLYQRLAVTVLAGLMLVCFTGCPAKETVDVEAAGTNRTATGAKRALISITSDPQADPQAVNMGLTFAGFCVDEGYDVSIFFNVKGVLLPVRTFNPEFRYLEHPPMIETLQKLHERGVQLHVCPVCMKDLDIQSDAILEEAFVTDKPKLFGQLGSDTMVFTY